MAAPAGPPPVPLLVPRDGTLTPLTDPIELQRLATRMTGSGDAGPVALDAERASGFRYSARAYLVQLRRADVGSVLIDPIPLRDLEPLQPALARSEWVLHAASQDLPCLAEIGLRPRTLFDTELAGRIAGLPKVGLGPLVEQMLGLGLEKGHGAADWSVRPLPAAWLNYAALDVEVLLELREAMISELDAQGKLDWAREEFAALVAAAPPAPRVDPWRRTSGIHKIRDRRALAVIRALWQARDAYASQRDIAPHRVLPDTAIVAAAVAAPTSVADLVALPLFAGRGQRRQADRWMAAIAAAQRLPESALPPTKTPLDGPPPPARWKEKNPDAAERLAAARQALTALGEAVKVPLENMCSPELVRRVCWSGAGSQREIEQILADGGARQWQIALVAGPLAGVVVR
ncbi:HRDC domain-containing protein [Nakamurella deserti]|uniref:HRDC domain-containing protein n=1 Tax=Nakamurella deserti TaxID=2164074 RepID=UPI000DBE9D80|nr:HRDC domain-containing protein [Nakamurella deserti]